MKASGSEFVSRVAVCSALVVGLILGCGVGAAFASTVYSNWQNWNVVGTTYSTRAYLTDSGTYGTQTKRADGAVSPAGYLGSSAGIWRGTTNCGMIGPVFNASSVVVEIVHSSYRHGPLNCVSAGYYSSKGLGYAYNPSTGSYVSHSTLNSPLKYLP